MTIFFTASLRAKSDMSSAYHHIYQVLSKGGNEVWADHVLNLETKQVKNWDIEYHFEFYQDIFNKIKTSDLVVAEITHDSLNIGYEVSIALSQRKPVIALFQGQTEPALVKQIDPDLASQRLSLIQYSDRNLISYLTMALEEAKRLISQRFTILLPAHIVNYLEEASQELGVPRAVYIRQLIEQDRTRKQAIHI